MITNKKLLIQTNEQKTIKLHIKGRKQRWLGYALRKTCRKKAENLKMYAEAVEKSTRCKEAWETTNNLEMNKGEEVK